MNNFNFSKYDILNNEQQNRKNNNYTLNNMFAYMDIGNIRTRQEDSVLLLEHPLKKEFKLMAVADGMGGLLNGGKASNLALLNIINWFEKIPEDYYYKETKILFEIYEELEYIDTVIRKYCVQGGTTLSMAIFTKNTTICINVGDSRIYIYANNNLKQISNDHSISWDLYKKGMILTKDDVRFHKKSNLITSRLGCEIKRLKIDSEIINVNDFENVYLFTDGVTDCLSDKQIEKVIKQNINNNVTFAIVEIALKTNSYNSNLSSEEYYSFINGGKDNLSVAAYIKKMK